MAAKSLVILLLSLVAVCTIASPLQLDTAVVRQGEENQVATPDTPNYNGGDDLGDDGPGDDSPAAIAAKKKAKEEKKKAKKSGLSNEEKAKASGNIHSFGNGNSDDQGEDSGENGVDSGEDKFGNDIGEDQSDNTSGPGGASSGGDEKGDDNGDDKGEGKDDDKPDDKGDDSGDDKGEDGSGNGDNEVGLGGGSVDGAKAGKNEPHNHAGHNHGADCFPGNADVELKSGETIKMASLKIGDEVSIGNGQYSEVFMFTHRLPAMHTEFLQVTTASGARLRLSAGHYLPVNGEYAAADTVRVGDEVVLGDGVNSRVVRVDTVADVGLFNPQTRHGDIVVNGVRASTYTTAVEPKAAHALLAPVRAVFARFGLAMTALESGSQTLANAAQCLFA